MKVSRVVPPSYYILAIQSAEGDQTSRYQSDSEAEVDYTYAIVCVDQDGAHVVDDLYRSVSEAAEAWPNAQQPAS